MGNWKMKKKWETDDQNCFKKIASDNFFSFFTSRLQVSEYVFSKLWTNLKRFLYLSLYKRQQQIQLVLILPLEAVVKAS